ncbi:TOBE domain-containing protein [Spongiimicrobium sp. 3-5]|uniref:TOBE domain-containing protein n=1 Tax=Spongiimicrobium sp. 3-5 TaxID=3332596 RepID=UPI00397EC60C
MNRLQGNIADIETSGNLSVVSVTINDQVLLKAIVVETPETATYLRMSNQVSVLFKETEVILGTGENHTISVQNKIRGSIINIDKGTLLSKVRLNTVAGEITAIVSTAAVIELNLKLQLNVTAIIKLNEMMLSEL